MPSDFPSATQEREMLRDVAFVETNPVESLFVRDMCCHVKALLSAIAKLRAERDRLRELAKPFAANWALQCTDTDYMDDMLTRITVRRGDIRRLAKVVKEGTNDVK